MVVWVYLRDIHGEEDPVIKGTRVPIGEKRPTWLQTKKPAQNLFIIQETTDANNKFSLTILWDLVGIEYAQWRKHDEAHKFMAN